MKLEQQLILAKRVYNLRVRVGSGMKFSGRVRVGFRVLKDFTKFIPPENYFKILDYTKLYK